VRIQSGAGCWLSLSAQQGHAGWLVDVPAKCHSVASEPLTTLYRTYSLVIMILSADMGGSFDSLSRIVVALAVNLDEIRTLQGHSQFLNKTFSIAFP